MARMETPLGPGPGGGLGGGRTTGSATSSYDTGGFQSWLGATPFTGKPGGPGGTFGAWLDTARPGRPVGLPSVPGVRGRLDVPKVNPLGWSTLLKELTLTGAFNTGGPGTDGDVQVWPGPYVFPGWGVLEDCSVPNAAGYYANGGAFAWGCGTGFVIPPFPAQKTVNPTWPSVLVLFHFVPANLLHPDYWQITKHYLKGTAGDAVKTGLLLGGVSQLPHWPAPGDITPGGGTSAGGGATGEWPDPDANPFPTTDARQPDDPPYKLPSVTRHVVPTKTGMGYGGPPIDTVHRQVPSNEMKAEWKIRLSRIIRLYHDATEWNDFFESLADAIPGRPCSKMPGFQRAVCVLEHWNEIDPIQAAKNLALNEIEDQLIGRGIGQLSELSTVGGPSTTQLTGYLRNVMK